jgi:hypothetical protein
LTIRNYLAIHQTLDHPRLHALDTSDRLRDEAGEQNLPTHKANTKTYFIHIKDKECLTKNHIKMERTQKTMYLDIEIRN